MSTKIVKVSKMEPTLGAIVVHPQKKPFTFSWNPSNINTMILFELQEQRYLKKYLCLFVFVTFAFVCDLSFLW